MIFRASLLRCKTGRRLPARPAWAPCSPARGAMAQTPLAQGLPQHWAQLLSLHFAKSPCKWAFCREQIQTPQFEKANVEVHRRERRRAGRVVAQAPAEKRVGRWRSDQK
jgi:hypothetical protein